jgi:hypothetical protein
LPISLQLIRHSILIHQKAALYWPSEIFVRS